MKTIRIVNGLTFERAVEVLHYMDNDPMMELFMFDGFPCNEQQLINMNNGHTLTVIVDNELAAVCWMEDENISCHDKKPMTCGVKLIYVIPRFRRYSVRIGIKITECITKVLGFSNILVTTRDDHFACQNFILRIGYTRVGIIPSYFSFGGKLKQAILYSWVKPLERSNV